MAYSLVAHVKGAGANTFTTSAVDTTGANFLAVWTVRDAGGSFTLSDSYGNTWTKHPDTPSAGLEGAWYYCSPPSNKVGAGHTFTLNGTGFYGDLFMQAWSGADTTAPFDSENSVFGTGVTSLATGSVSPSVNNELVLVGFATTSGDTFSINLGFQISDQAPLVGGVSYGGLAAYLVQTTKGAVNPTISWTNTEFGSSAAIACFKPGTGTSAPAPFMFQPFAI